MRPFHSIRVINLLKRNFFAAYARATALRRLSCKINLSRNKRVCKNRLSYTSYEIRISILRIVETLPSLSDRCTYAARSCTNTNTAEFGSRSCSMAARVQSMYLNFPTGSRTRDDTEFTFNHIVSELRANEPTR